MKPVISSFNVIAPLLIQQYERYLPTAFDESMSLVEKVNKVINHLNAMGELSNSVVEQWNSVMEWTMNDGLDESVVAKLDSLVEDGTMDKIINLNVFGDFENRVTDTELNKMDKETTDIRVNQINKNLGKFDQTYLADELLQQMAGTTPVNAVPADNSLTTSKYADDSVTIEKTSFARKGKNLWDGLYTDGIRPTGSILAGMKAQTIVGSKSIIFKSKPNTTYTISRQGTQGAQLYHVATFASLPVNSLNAIRSLNDGAVVYAEKTITTQGNEEYIMFSISGDNSVPTGFQIEEGSIATSIAKPNSVRFDLDHQSIKHEFMDLENFKDKWTPNEMSFARAGKNLWDGTLVRDIRMSGAPPSVVGSSVGAVSLIFKGEKGKTYSISKSMNTDYDGVFILDTLPIVGATGTRQINGNGVKWGTKTITLQGEEQWIFISLSSATQKAEPEWLQIEEGAYVTNYVKPKSVKIDLDLDVSDIAENTSLKMQVNKTGETMIIYVPSKSNNNRFIGHTYRRYTSSGADTWLYDTVGTYLYSDGAYVPEYMFSNGNSDNEGVLFVQGESDFIGGKHGYDIMEDLSVIVDGKEMNMSLDFSEKASFVKIVNKSRVNHDLSEDLPQNKAFTRYKVHTWDLDTMTLYGKWIAEHNMNLTTSKLCDFSIDQNVNGKVISKYGRNNVDFIKYDISGNFVSTPHVKNVDTQEIWSDEVELYLALSCKWDREKYPNHYTHIEQLGGTRSKIYFDITGAYTIGAGESIQYLNTYDFRI